MHICKYAVFPNPDRLALEAHSGFQVLTLASWRVRYLQPLLQPRPQPSSWRSSGVSLHPTKWPRVDCGKEQIYICITLSPEKNITR